jgi:hypothetical protein
MYEMLCEKLHLYFLVSFLSRMHVIISMIQDDEARIKTGVFGIYTPKCV